MRYVAFLRGVNLGGKTMVRMEELRAIFEALAFEGVKTYINSGNVGFDPPSSARMALRRRQLLNPRSKRPCPVGLAAPLP
jgi:uncharacterized protein (DUF1697 family)